MTKDPELRLTTNGISVATFCVAVDRDHDREKTDFVNVVAWRQTAEFVEKYFRKGQMIVVSGSLQMRDWKDKDGNKRIAAEVNAERVYFCGDRREGQSQGFEEIDDDGDLPF